MPASQRSASAVQLKHNPEFVLGGFAHNDHRLIFYQRVNALLRPDMTVLDFGAGRGKWAELEDGYLLSLTTLKGKCRRLIGADVGEAVRQNPLLDEAIMIAPDGSIPLPDGSVDMIVSWAVFEHVANPLKTSQELNRILKPGGFICAFTPNKWGYVAIAARLVPNRLHYRMLAAARQSARKEHDVFPTTYLMNTRRALRKWFPPDRFSHHSYIANGPPTYHGNTLLVASLWQAWGKYLPQFFGKTIHIFLQKHPIG